MRMLSELDFPWDGSMVYLGLYGKELNNRRKISDASTWIDIGMDKELSSRQK